MLNGITRRWPSAPLVLSALALFVSLGGVGYAAATIGSGQIVNNTIQSKDIKNKAIAGKDVKDNTLGPSQVNESRLGKVPNAGKADTATSAGTAGRANTAGSATMAGSATTAANAAAVGGTPLAGLLQVNKCQAGQVLGFARILGRSGTVPATFTTNPGAVDLARNCSGGSVEARKLGTGEYLIRFNGNTAALAFAQPRFDADSDDDNNFATVAKRTTGDDAGAFHVAVWNSVGRTDADVTVLLP